MIAAYLWLNAALYAIFAAWCAWRWQDVSHNLGYLSLSPGGRSEYFVVYGGLQVGLALFFAWTASRPDLHRTGLLFALAVYVPIVLVRWSSIALLHPVARTTFMVGLLETTLLALAIALWFGRSRAG